MRVHIMHIINTLAAERLPSNCVVCAHQSVYI